MTDVSVRISVDRRSVGMGRSVTLRAAAALSDGKPAAGRLLLPYVDGRRWGAHEIADAEGRAVWRLPLPNPGVAEIAVEARPASDAPPGTGSRSPAQFEGGRLARKPWLLDGYVLPHDACVSNTVRVRVLRRSLATIPHDADHVVGVQYCPLYTPAWFNWDTAQAVPLVGFYRTWDRDVIRQHMIWLAESGVQFLVVDWVNHLFGTERWEDRSGAALETIHATTVLLENLAALRDEGIEAPRVLLMLGLNNGAHTTIAAINGEIGWIYDNYVRNPRFAGLLQEYRGKPLLLVFNGSGEPTDAAHGGPIDDRHFTIRYQSAQHQSNHQNRLGYWSWMDGSLQQPVTMFDGKPEAMTVSVGFFDEKGWKGDTAYGRRGGWTYVESFKNALRVRPRFIQLHQFQEFAGTPETPGGWYGDSYSPELSDDIEPTSLTAPAYRGDGGWGFRWLNLTRALVDLYRQQAPETTVLAIDQPLRPQTVTGDRLDVTWTWAGKAPSRFRILLDGRTVARGVHGTHAVVDLHGVANGAVTLTVVAEGTHARYAVSSTEDSLPDPKLPPARDTMAFVLRR